MDSASILTNLISCLGYPVPNSSGTPTLTSEYFKISFYEDSITLTVMDMRSSSGGHFWFGSYRKDCSPKNDSSALVANVAFQLFQGISSDALFEKLRREY